MQLTTAWGILFHILITWIIPICLAVLSTEPELYKMAADRQLRLSTEQCNPRSAATLYITSSVESSCMQVGSHVIRKCNSTPQSMVGNKSYCRPSWNCCRLARAKETFACMVNECCQLKQLLFIKCWCCHRHKLQWNLNFDLQTEIISYIYKQKTDLKFTILILKLPRHSLYHNWATFNDEMTFDDI